MDQNNLSLAALIGSRICHDLISPIGAINNGMELLSMSGVVPGAEMDLIGESVGNASARIRFFRIAFGAAGDHMVGRSEVVSILRDLYAVGRLKVEWDPQEAQPRSAVRLAFLAIMCLETGMPYGGTIQVSKDDATWALVGFADKYNIDPNIWSTLNSSSEYSRVEPAHVQFSLLRQIAQHEGIQLDTRHSDGELSLTF